MAKQKIFFAGEHNAPLHPQVLQAMIKANNGKAPSYRGDDETKEMSRKFNDMFGTEVKTYTFSSGTAANVAAIASMVKPYNSVICAKSAHIQTYEAGAPTRFTGCMFDLIPTQDGKISPKDITKILQKKTKENVYTQPKVVFITQPTEYGIVYSIDELKTLGEFCKKNDLYLYIDGARIANAIAKLDVDIKYMSTDIGVDALFWGGIKDGGLVDVLVFFNKEITHDMEFVYKHLGQDVAKSRYYSASVNGLIKNNVWIKNAQHSNEMTAKLYDQIKNNKYLKFVLPIETNFIWAVMPEKMYKTLSNDFEFYQETNDLDIDEYKEIPFFARIVTSWATTEDEINAFAKAINSF